MNALASAAPPPPSGPSQNNDFLLRVAIEDFRAITTRINQWVNLEVTMWPIALVALSFMVPLLMQAVQTYTPNATPEIFFFPLPVWIAAGIVQAVAIAWYNGLRQQDFLVKNIDAIQESIKEVVPQVTKYWGFEEAQLKRINSRFVPVLGATIGILAIVFLCVRNNWIYHTDRWKDIVANAFCLVLNLWLYVEILLHCLSVSSPHHNKLVATLLANKSVAKLLDKRSWRQLRS